MNESNVVMFPKENPRNNLPQSEPELYEAIMNNRTMLVDEITNRFFTQFASVLHINGFDMEEKEFFLKYITATEMMKSVLYEYVGLSHPLTDVINNNIEVAKDLSFIEDLSEIDNEDDE